MSTRGDDLKAAFEFSGQEYELRRRVLTTVHAFMVALGVRRIEVPLYAYDDADPERLTWTQNDRSFVIERHPEPVPCEHCDGTGLVRPEGSA